MEKETSFFLHLQVNKSKVQPTTTVVSISPRKNEENGLHYEKLGLRVGGSIPFDLEIDLMESEGKIPLLTDA